jgi:hypothetical protein
MAETLAEEFSGPAGGGEFTASFELNGEEVTAGIARRAKK